MIVQILVIVSFAFTPLSAIIIEEKERVEDVPPAVYVEEPPVEEVEVRDPYWHHHHYHDEVEVKVR